MDSSKTRVTIHAKNKRNSDEQYIGDYRESDMKRIAFHHSIKGFYNRLKMGIESKSPNELKTYYKIQSNTMQLILEEISKFDDDSTKWIITLSRKKMNEKIPTVNATLSTTDANDAALKQISYVVKQVKDKFNAEKEERLKLEERVQALEQLCTKLTKKLVKVNNDLKKEREKHIQTSTDSKDDMFSSSQENVLTSSSQSVVKPNGSDHTQLMELQSCIENVERKYGNELHIINQKMDDIRPKLVRLKTRRDFASEQTFIDYITNKLEQWDANKFGPILVRVMDTATGKAKQFIGYVGEPQKWNHTICKVQWFGLGKKLPEAVEWKALDVFLPLSAFYYPDCPHARAYASRKQSPQQQL